MDDIQSQLKQHIETHPVILFMKGTPDFPQCGFSSQAIGALKTCGADFTYVNVLDNDVIRQGIKEYSNWPTIPQLYVKGEFVGGSDIIVDLYEQGELQKMLAATAPAE